MLEHKKIQNPTKGDLRRMAQEGWTYGGLVGDTKDVHRFSRPVILGQEGDDVVVKPNKVKQVFTSINGRLHSKVE